MGRPRALTDLGFRDNALIVKSGARKYSLGARAEAMEANRERIVAAALELFLARYYDEVALEDIAARAGVSLPTVTRHFGKKEAILHVIWERETETVTQRRNVAPGDAAAAARVLVADYEINGLATVRALALEERMPELKAVLDRGRKSHRAWVETTFAPWLAACAAQERTRRVAQLALAGDVYAWKLWRLDFGLSRAETTSVMQGSFEALRSST
jgi:AcrR family transcriptional regulator